MSIQTNRFKGLDLIDRVPEELWTEVADIVQEAVFNTTPKKKKCKKTKWLSEEALQIGEKRTEAKGKGEKERYTHLNAEFQRERQESKERQESLPQGSVQRNREKIEWERLEISSRKSDTKGTFHAKMGTIKNSMDRTKAEDTKKR